MNYLKMYKVIIILLHIITLIEANYYEILGVSRLANQNEIRKAFKKLAIVYHPDKSTDPNAHDKFIRLTTAYEVLKNNDSRKKYDLNEEDFDNSYKKPTFFQHSWNYYQYFDMYEDDEYVIKLENDDYENVIDSESSWFVNFYSPECSHCHTLAPIWKKVAKLFDGIVKMAAVNCVHDKHLCHRLNIRAYPTLLYYTKNLRHGTHYMGKKTEDAIMQFVLDGVHTYVPKIDDTQLRLFLTRIKDLKRKMPTLILICNERQNCLSPNDRLIITAKFDKLIDIKLFTWENDNSQNNRFSNTHAIYLPVYNNTSSWKPIFFDGLFNINILIEQLLNQLPSPQELTENDFMILEETKSNVGWLIYFSLDDSMATNLQLRKLNDINLGKINCGKNKEFCTNLGVSHYPMWGMFKPGGAFELNHGKTDNNANVMKFAQLSMKTTNVWALNETKILSILQRKTDEVWFLDWYTPWCPSCIDFLSELRIASLQFNSSVVRFGTINCAVYITLCHEYKIRYYPTAMLINGNDIYKFKMQKTAANVIRYINEKRDTSIVELTLENFYHKLGKKQSYIMWIIDYFVDWCGPCKKLMPEWKAVAKTLMNVSFVKVGSMDCEIEAKMCRFLGIKSYPTIRLYPLDSEGLSRVALYNGQRDSLSILTWITSFFPKKIHDLNPSDYQKALNSKHMWIVNFYLPQCWHCQKMEPEFAIASHLLEKVKFGRINCNFYMHECAHVKIFPTLILYDPKQKINNGIKINATTAETIKEKILHIINLPLKHDEL